MDIPKTFSKLNPKVRDVFLAYFNPVEIHGFKVVGGVFVLREGITVTPSKNILYIHAQWRFGWKFYFLLASRAKK